MSLIDRSSAEGLVWPWPGGTLGNLGMGISYTWWTRKHNQHHANPNHITDDPDASYPMLAMFPEQVALKARWARPIIAIQAYLYPILGAFVFINMRVPSITLLFGRNVPRRIPQAIGLALHWMLFGLLLTQLGGWSQALTFLHRQPGSPSASTTFPSSPRITRG